MKKTDKVSAATWQAKESQNDQEKEQGVYFIKTIVKGKDERTIWKIYNCIRDPRSAYEYL
jgi:3-deoxy-D-arabino-heptulosonate 7-phosphate (DAHP) synthase